MTRRWQIEDRRWAPRWQPTDADVDRWRSPGEDPVVNVDEFWDGAEHRRTTSRGGSGGLGTKDRDGDRSCSDDNQIPMATCRQPRTIPTVTSSTTVEDECVMETQQILEVETMQRPTTEKPKKNGKKTRPRRSARNPKPKNWFSTGLHLRLNIKLVLNRALRLY
jgi:hypothetical protein